VGHLFGLVLLHRTPKSLLAGLMWLGLKQGQGYSLRHTCDESDGLAGYSSWVCHDGTTYGRQVNHLLHQQYRVKLNNIWSWQ